MVGEGETLDEARRRFERESAGTGRNGASDNAESGAPPPLMLLWYATLGEANPQEQLVKNLLFSGSLAVVFGESNSGKTYFVLDLGLAIAAGIPWRGRRTRRGLVLYVAGEGAASVRSRVCAYRIAHPDISTGIAFAIIPQAVDFLNGESVDALVETINAAASESGEAIALVIVDTFARAIPGGNENDAQDVGLAVAAADRIRVSTGACVCFVHHAGKDPTKGARGSSALRAAADTEILIDGQTGARVAIVSKQRDLEAGEPMGFELKPVPIGKDPDDDSEITACVVTHADGPPRSAAAPQLRGKVQRQLIAALRERTKADPDRIWTLMDLRQVGRELGLHKNSARSAVDAIVVTPYLQTTIGGYKFVDGEPKC